MISLLTIDETAALLRFSDRTDHAMRRGGRLPGTAGGSGKWRGDRVTLLDWLARGGELAEHDKAEVATSDDAGHAGQLDLAGSATGKGDLQ